MSYFGPGYRISFDAWENSTFKGGWPSASPEKTSLPYRRSYYLQQKLNQFDGKSPYPSQEVIEALYAWKEKNQARSQAVCTKEDVRKVMKEIRASVTPKLLTPLEIEHDELALLKNPKTRGRPKNPFQNQLKRWYNIRSLLNDTYKAPQMYGWESQALLDKLTCVDVVHQRYKETFKKLHNRKNFPDISTTVNRICKTFSSWGWRLNPDTEFPVLRSEQKLKKINAQLDFYWSKLGWDASENQIQVQVTDTPLKKDCRRHFVTSVSKWRQASKRCRDENGENLLVPVSKLSRTISKLSHDDAIRIYESCRSGSRNEEEASGVGGRKKTYAGDCRSLGCGAQEVPRIDAEGISRPSGGIGCS